MTDDDIIAETNRILARMSSGEPFQFADLWRPEIRGSIRIASELFETWRRRKWIELDFKRQKYVWTLTDAGRAAVRKEAADD